MSKRTRSIARANAARISHLSAHEVSSKIDMDELYPSRARWRNHARRREIAFKYRESIGSRVLLANGLKGVQPLPIVTPALRWSFHSTVGRNGAVRWHAHQVNAGLSAFLGHGVPGEATTSVARSATPARWRRP